MIDYQTSMFDASIMTSPISITTLATLASAGVLRTVQLVGQVGGYTVMVRVGQTEKQLTGQRGEPRGVHPRFHGHLQEGRSRP
ncbi:hypothetical protein F7R02_25060 [Xanthomonas cissicola]|nr:hypothetical protein F7R02_25060 [Xanthomonas cissicola]